VKSTLVCLLIAIILRLAYEILPPRIFLLFACILAVYSLCALFLALCYFAITLVDRIAKWRHRRLAISPVRRFPPPI